MADYSNITGGLKIPTQIPLDVKTVSINEATLANLGTDNNLAYTYYDGLKVYCFLERSTYEWREVQTGEENTGLVTSDFTYPDNIITFGITYSNKVYNFFEVTYITTANLEAEVGTLPPGPPGDDGIPGDDGLNADMTRTSVTSNTIANSGSKTFNYAVSNNLGWLEGTRLRFSKDVNNYMEGVITDVSSTSVDVNIDNSAGSGTYTSWNITIAGDKGSSGTTELIIVEDTASTLTITTQDTEDLDYDISFQLDGDKCFYTGIITNNTAGTLTSQDVFAFVDSTYYVKSTYDTISLGLNGGGIIRRILLHNTVLTVDEIESAESIEISGWYFTN
jgi:hypothetical protein